MSSIETGTNSESGENKIREDHHHDDDAERNLHIQNERMLMTRLKKEMSGLLKPGYNGSSSMSLQRILTDCCTNLKQKRSPHRATEKQTKKRTIK